MSVNPTPLLHPLLLNEHVGMSEWLILVLAAIASNLAKGMSVPQSVKAACRYVEAAIKTAPGLGSGNGPLNHFHSTFTLPFAPSVPNPQVQLFSAELAADQLTEAISSTISSKDQMCPRCGIGS